MITRVINILSYLDDVCISFCGIALSHLNEELQLHVFVLGCFPYDHDNQTANQIRQFVDCKLMEFNLSLDNNKFVVSDDANKMKSAFKDSCIRIGCSIHYVNKQLEYCFTIDIVDKAPVKCDIVQQIFFHEVIEQLSSDTKPTVYKVLLFKQYLLNQCNFHPDDHDGIQQIKTFLEKRIQGVWILNDVHFITTLLYPSFKNFDISPDLHASAIDLTKKEQLKRHLSVSSITCTTNMKSHLQQKLKFPTLFTMVQDFYAIPASNIIIERLFSPSKNTVTDKRTSLEAEKVNELLFLQKILNLLKQICKPQVVNETASTETKRKINFESSCSASCDGQEQLATTTVKKKPKVNEENGILCSEDDKENDEIDCF
ncbi:unnamed protein product [Rotaria socialis]|uniref:HAT C-terminal dimerisation domain-containing protein n=2 Tax=Rotaria socialis TaxID=392032 RepID=A0A820S8N0_9BILA|nr:unnamed protein product [Rotaria socialis]CAF4687281.1 unnamed protein product [Rotaria socialis]